MRSYGRHYTDNLPVTETIGVYVLIDRLGEIFYIGEGFIRKRLAKHIQTYGIANRTPKKLHAIKRVCYLETKSKTTAVLIETYLIGRLRPIKNTHCNDELSESIMLSGFDDLRSWQCIEIDYSRKTRSIYYQTCANPLDV